MAKKRPEHPDDRAFNGAWSLLHVVAALQCAMILMHLGSARYHALRVMRTDDSDT